MLEELKFIQLQLWVLIGLFGLFILLNVLCNRCKNRDKKQNEPSFSLMFDKDQLDELIEQSSKHLELYPNHSSALFFGAKALIVRKQFTEAIKYLERLSTIEPSLLDSYQDMIDDCKKHENS
jgi:tetratricopeptide (TPR) repeat protein